MDKQETFAINEKLLRDCDMQMKKQVETIAMLEEAIKGLKSSQLQEKEVFSLLS